MDIRFVFVALFSCFLLPKLFAAMLYPNCQIYQNSYRYSDQDIDYTCEMQDATADVSTVFQFPSSQWREFLCSNCSLGMIPFGLFEHNSQAQVLSLSRSGINQLSVRDFINARSLYLLNVSHNSIQTLESYLFVHAGNLEIIDLSHNQISVISDYTFANNSKLKSLKLNDNQLIIFSTVVPTSVQSLFLQNNKLMSLMDSLNLVQLDMSNNSQLQLDAMPTATILKLTHIDLKVCTILAETSLSIDLTGNLVDSIVIEGYSTAIIKELYLAQNKLYSVANLTELRFLEVLDLSMNPIVDIGLQTFTNMVELRTLRLEDSGLQHLPFGMFSQQTKLVELDISYNRLGQLDLSQLTLFKSLAILYVDGNNLNEIDVNEAKHMANQLTTVGLADNQFNCSFLISLSRIFANKIVVDAAKAQLNESNVLGMACQPKSDNSSNATRSYGLTPLIRSAATHSGAYNEIESRLANISDTIRQMAHKKDDSSQSQQGELLELRQNMASLRNELEERLLEMKSNIVLSVADILNVNDNQTRNGSALESTLEKLNQLNVERFKLLAERVERMSKEINAGQDKSSVSLFQNYSRREVIHEDSSSNKWFIVCVLFLVLNTGLAALFVFGRLGYSCGQVSGSRRSTSMTTVMTSC